MNTVHHVRKLLLRYGTYIYTGDRVGDMELMMLDIKELYEAGFIEAKEYTQALLILRKEKRLVGKGKDD